MALSEKLTHVLQHTLAYHSHDKMDAMPADDELESWDHFV